MERHKHFTRRVAILGGIKIALFSTLGVRLAYLQITENERFQTLSDKNRISMKLLSSERGEIMDRFGVPLAINTQNFRVFLIPEQSADIDQTLDKIGQIIPLSDKKRQKITKSLKKQRGFTPLLIKETLTWQQMAQIEINIPSLPGISVHEGKIRHYPLGVATGHIIGYVGSASESEITDDPIMRIPGFRIGKTGIEKKYDPILRGKVGTSKIEVNSSGREIRELETIPSQNGKRIHLTIDAELQMFCQERLSQENSAAAVIMNAHTGEVYALNSSPGFDPNLFTMGISAEKWEELLSDPYVPLTNKAISGQYPPGSTFKMVTALAALESGVDPSHNVHCPGYTDIGRDRFHCWKRGGHGKINFTSSLEQSCDVFYYDIARKTGIENIAKMARRLGMGQKLDLNLPSEAPGLIPDKEWKLAHIGRRWQIGETVVAGIGQGYIQTTPLQLATMTARLINGGYAVKPTLIKPYVNDKPIHKKWAHLGLKESHLAIIRGGMYAVMNGKKGTARAAQIKDKAFRMGGKTGTAQVRRITKKQRALGVKNKDLPWKQRHHALFVAYAPLNNPKYVCAVIVEHGVSGSGTAAPLARDLMHEVQKRAPANNTAKGI